ncbi:hypothetical protein [Tropicibacter oceani]|uniref:DUF1127 domain-containing protein n=1 Tax=Tropicibacter oceani TaxID=3058420 RepID=A0ABY8QGQ2_9RHOB|nr:hypothetical protein [Tropicibacter oceani]WGW03332.1 hypothetical protein QF118_15580 [Tropicibacter oceani]
MAFADLSLAPRRVSLFARLARLLDTPFDRRHRRLSARVAELRALSDRQLAEIGLTRDTILLHVFRGH